MTPLATAAKGVLLVEEAGYTPRQAAEKLGLSEHTVYNIVRGDDGWDERKNAAIFQKYLVTERTRLQHAMTQLAKESLVHAEEMLPKASYLQAVTGMAIMVDKSRLLAGEPTAIVATIDMTTASALDKLANMLGRSLVEEPKPIEIVAEKEEKP